MTVLMDAGSWERALDLGLHLFYDYVVPDNSDLRHQIVKCYRKLGLPNLAEDFILASDFCFS